MLQNQKNPILPFDWGNLLCGYADEYQMGVRLFSTKLDLTQKLLVLDFVLRWLLLGKVNSAIAATCLVSEDAH